MEEHNCLECWMEVVRQRREYEEENGKVVSELADILFEAFMWQLEGKKEEPKVKKVEKKIKVDPEWFYY